MADTKAGALSAVLCLPAALLCNTMNTKSISLIAPVPFADLEEDKFESKGGSSMTSDEVMKKRTGASVKTYDDGSSKHRGVLYPPNTTIKEFQPLLSTVSSNNFRRVKILSLTF